MSSRWGAPHQPPVSTNDTHGGGDRESRRGERGYQDAATSMKNNQRGYPTPKSSQNSGDRRRDRDDNGRDSGQRHGVYGRGGEDWRDMEDNNHCNDRIRGDEQGWRCMECGLDNYPQDECCPRCRTWKGEKRGGSDRPSSRDRRSSYDEGNHRNYPGGRGYDDDDYYDRRRSGSRDDRWDDLHDFASRGESRRGRDDYEEEEDDFGRRPRKKQDKKKPEWPPHFESSGGSFMFDARSGMFYEPHSDFFYDPKTKMYYSNKKQQYFTYQAEMKPHVFQPVGGSVGSNQAAAGQGTHTSSGANDKTSEKEQKPKKKIAISLKTAPPKGGGVQSLNEVAAREKTRLIKENSIKRKESAISAAGENNTAASTVPQAHKKHAKDMNIWSDRVKEMKEEDKCTDVQQPPSKKVKTTTSGQPICVLCRRKFATLEKLVQHENLSALHKENLAKKVASDAADAAKKKNKQESDTSYRDRSKERRQMFGSDAPESSSSHAEALLAHSLGSGAVPERTKPAETIRPEETLNNDTNVGNKLLQKMGWKSGESLGRNGNDTGNDSAASNLKKDWEKIESLAQNGGGVGRRR